MSEVSNWGTLTKTSVTSSHYIPVTSKLKFQLQSLFPSVTSAGVGSESLFSSITNKNQLNFKGIKSGDTGLLTVTTASDNIVITALEAGIDLSKCDNSTSNFISTVALASNVSGILSVVNGGTGLSTITKGSLLYGSATGTIAATSPMATNGQLLIGNATNGYPSVATLTAGTGMTITNSAGAITLAAAFSSAAATIDMNTFNINLDAAAGNSYLSGDGASQGATVDALGRVILKNNASAGILSTTSQLSLQGDTVNAIEIGQTNDYKSTYHIFVRNATSGVGAAMSLTAATGGTNSNGGDINVNAGAGAGSGDGGTTIIHGGAGGASGAGGAVRISTYAGSGSGSLGAALTIDNAQNVMLPGGFLRFSQTPQTLTGAGAIDVTSSITWIVTTGADALTLADGVEGQTKMIVMKTDGGNGTLTPANFAQGTTITFDAVGDSVSLLFTNSGWHVMGGHGYAIA